MLLNYKRNMKTLLTIFIAMAIVTANGQKLQTKYKRVRNAYKEKDAFLEKILAEKNIKTSNVNVILVSLKKERKLQVWVKKRSKKKYKHLIDYDFCSFSGTLGPKRQGGDGQIPEGLYHISLFNPYSNFHLSMKVSYPNRSDRILGVSGNLGGDIFIHGSCCTIGCIPITDDKIKELYTLCLYAKAAGQKRIPVYMFPGKMDALDYEILKKDYQSNKKLIRFWDNLKPAYDKFFKTKKKIKFSINKKGKYIL